MVHAEVAYAGVEEQKIISVEIPEGSTIFDVILASGILKLFPDISLAGIKIGVFSEFRKLSDVVQEGERVEIYRPLQMNPKEARRKKAKAS